MLFLLNQLVRHQLNVVMHTHHLLISLLLPEYHVALVTRLLLLTVHNEVLALLHFLSYFIVIIGYHKAMLVFAFLHGHVFDLISSCLEFNLIYDGLRFFK